MIQLGSKDSTPEYFKIAREVHVEVSLPKTTEWNLNHPTHVGSNFALLRVAPGVNERISAMSFLK